MFIQSRIKMPTKLEEEFSKPVESIMRCEDFKSNFARRLSNRYISRSPVSSPKQETALKLYPRDSNAAENPPDSVPERIELGPQLSKKIEMEQNGETVKPPDKLMTKSSQVRTTEVSVLNMEVETLRWQLAQTETNRQMHKALLKQIVAFLNRVKEHIECQNNDKGSKQDSTPTRILPRSFNVADLPRSRSVVHVNRNAECFLSTPKKMSARRISKSISNVNGFKDCANMWNQSKLSLTAETDSSQKISEEISRLITLANTVLGTKLPDLACSYNDKFEINKPKLSTNEKPKDSPPNSTFNEIEEDDQNFAIDTMGENRFNENGDENKCDKKIEHLNISKIFINNELQTAFSDVDLVEKEDKVTKERVDMMNGVIKKSLIEKRNDFNSSNFIEDESGFSSMSSFQEIGIPIISIIPPSPCQEMGFLEEMPDLIEGAERWKTDTTELDKQSVKVFWV